MLREGDVVKIDVGAFYKGFHGDSARTIPVGKVSDEAAKLIDVTRQSFFDGVAQLSAGNRMGDIGNAIQTRVENNGFSVVKRYIGHGIGHELHESPDVPNFGTAGRGTRLCVGMAIAIEPMVNIGSEEVYEMADGWTVKTRDKSLSAHYENTCVLTSDGAVITTLVDKDW